MKHFGSKLDFTKQRDEDILRVFKQYMQENNHIIMPEIFERVAASPAQRFWVSEERAAIIISAIENRRPLGPMRQNKREMFREIYRRYVRLRAAHPNIPLRDLVSQIVHSPAPRFYLTARTLGEIYYRIRASQTYRKRQ